METNEYIQLLLGNGYVSKYNKKSDYYMVDPPCKNPMIFHDINYNIYRQNTGAPSNYLPTQQNFSQHPSQQRVGQPSVRRKNRKRKRNLNDLSEFY